MDEKAKKRPWFWFQVHLSTLIVLHFVAAGFLWLNLTPHLSGKDWEENPNKSEGLTYGFPLNCFNTGAFEGNKLLASTGNQALIASSEWKPWNVFLDTGFAVTVLLVTGLVCEWRIRRAQAKAEPPKDGTR